MHGHIRALAKSPDEAEAYYPVGRARDSEIHGSLVARFEDAARFRADRSHLVVARLLTTVAVLVALDPFPLPI